MSYLWLTHCSLLLTLCIDIARAVAGLFNDMGSMKPDLDDWDQRFADALSIYKEMRSEDQARSNKHEVRPDHCQQIEARHNTPIDYF